MPTGSACTNRSGAMVERLLAAGADANAASINGETVLMTCARAGEPRAVKALLVKGARVRHPQFGAGTVLELSGFGADVRAARAISDRVPTKSRKIPPPNSVG